MLEKSWVLSADLKEETDRENLMSFGVLERCMKKLSHYDSVLTNGMHSIQLSSEDWSCLEGVYVLSRSER